MNDLGGALDGSGSSMSAADRVVDEITAFGGSVVPNHDSVATSDGGQAIVQAALAGLTRVLSIEWASDDIKVNAIAPIASTRMTQDILGDLAVKVSPESVSPLVAYLAHEECSVTGHIYSVAGGRVARIFVAETRGVVLSDNTAEAVRDNLSLIDELDAEGYHHPASLDDETTIIAQALLNVS